MKETVIYRTWDEPMADMAVGLLKAENINAWKTCDVARSVYPFTMDGLGEIEIRVYEENAEAALEILAVRFSDTGTIIDEFPDISENNPGKEDII